MAVTVTVSGLPPIGEDSFLEVAATRSLSPGRRVADANLFRVLQTFGFDEIDPVDLTAAYVARFGNPLAGRVLFIRLRVITNDGLTSYPLIVRATIT